MPNAQTRRRFLSTVSLAGAASLLRPPAVFAAEGRLETTTIRLTKVTDMCMAPQFVMEDLLRAEGFTDIQYVEIPIPEIAQTIGSGKADLGLSYIYGFLLNIDRGCRSRWWLA
jgi:NitT/TauT family transport system substrate-binding protein